MAVNDDPRAQKSQLFAFFGSDISTCSTELLAEQFADGFALLALDVHAMGVAHRADLPYTVIDDWLSIAALKRAKWRATKCEAQWFQSQSNGFSSAGICWPHLDHHAMHWFWMEVMVAEELAEAFKDGNVTSLRFFQDLNPRASVYYYPSDVVGYVWQNRLEAAHPYPRKPPVSQVQNYVSLMSWFRHPADSAERLIRSVRKRVGLGMQLPKTRQYNAAETTAVDLSVHTDKIVFAISAGELDRFAPIIDMLSHANPNKVSLILVNGDNTLVKVALEQLSIPVTLGPVEVAISPLLDNQFSQAYEELRCAENDVPWAGAIAGLPFHFDYYCKFRWPKLANAYSFWLELWSRHRPSAVIISSLSDAESLLPGKAATEIGIDCWAIPHGAVQGRPILYHPPEITFLYGLDLQQHIYRRLGLTNGIMVGCRDAFIEREYPGQRDSAAPTAGKLSVLAITNPVGFKDCIATTISTRAQQRAFQCLYELAERNSTQLVVQIKPHPHPEFSDFSLVEATSEKLGNLMLSSNIDLVDLLATVNIVIAVNYFGSALIHAFRQGKPVIFLWTDSLIGETALTSYATLFEPAGATATNSESLQGMIDQYQRDSEWANTLCHKSREFARCYLDNLQFTALAELLNTDMVTSYEATPPVRRPQLFRHRPSEG